MSTGTASEFVQYSDPEEKFRVLEPSVLVNSNVKTSLKRSEPKELGSVDLIVRKAAEDRIE